MNQNLTMNTRYAIHKASEPVRSWEKALAANIAANNLEGIEFCRKSLEACTRNLEAVRKDIKENWTMYL